MKLVERKIILRADCTNMSEADMENLVDSLCDIFDTMLNIMRADLSKDIEMEVDDGMGEFVWKG